MLELERTRKSFIDWPYEMFSRGYRWGNIAMDRNLELDSSVTIIMLHPPVSYSTKTKGSSRKVYRLKFAANLAY